MSITDDSRPLNILWKPSESVGGLQDRSLQPRSSVLSKPYVFLCIYTNIKKDGFARAFFLPFMHDI